MANEERTRYLLSRVMDGSASEEVLQELIRLVESDESGSVRNEITSVLENKKTEAGYRVMDWNALADSILSADKIKRPDQDQVTVIRRISRWRYAAAAAIIIGIFAGLYFMRGEKKEIPVLLSQSERFKNDVQPGHNGAVLTLSNGNNIILDSAENGALTVDQQAHIVKKDGEISYEGKTSEIIYNTISTDRGRQWQVTLSDGSRVWLNAASSIRYPVAFVGQDRPVEITGEVYFEVAKNASKPFIVKTRGQEIRVLGTHFNINAYDDEGAVRTTLLEGSVSVKNNKQTVIIKPGEQARENSSNEWVITKDVDLAGTMAWKDGLFRFKETTIQPLMRQVARWYDVDVSYEGGEVKQHFIATIPRTANAQDVFKALELTGRVHFKIEGKKVIVMP